MKSKSFIALAMVLGIAGSIAARAGTDVSGGGDGYAAEFIETAKAVLAAAKARNSNTVPQDDLQKAILTTQVETTLDPLRDSLGFERDAINIPAKRLIRVNRLRWKALNQQQRDVLSVHEYLGIMGMDDLSYKLSAPYVASVRIPERLKQGFGAFTNLSCYITSQQGRDPGSQFRVSAFNLAGLDNDFRGNPLETYLIADFYGGGVFIAKKTGYSGGDDFGNWTFHSIFREIGADETAPENTPAVGKIKTVIELSGHPLQIRSTFAKAHFALKGKDADRAFKGTMKPKKIKGGFRGVYEDGSTFDANLECTPVQEHGTIFNQMFSAIGGVERMISR